MSFKERFKNPTVSLLCPRKRIPICGWINEILFSLGLFNQTYTIRRKIGWIYYRLTAKTCSWHPHADLDDLLDQIIGHAK